VECRTDNGFNLRDLVLQELVKIIVVYYIKKIQIKIQMGNFYTISIKNYIFVFSTQRGCLTWKKNSIMVFTFRSKRESKGKIHPRTSYGGPEGEYSYSFALSLTSSLDGNEWSTPRPGRFTSGKDPVPIV